MPPQRVWPLWHLWVWGLAWLGIRRRRWGRGIVCVVFWKIYFRQIGAEIQVCFFRFRRDSEGILHFFERIQQWRKFSVPGRPETGIMWRPHWHVVWSFAICESCSLKALMALQMPPLFGWQFKHNVSAWIHGPEEVTWYDFRNNGRLGRGELFNRELISPNKLPSTICWNSDGICGQNLQICCQWRCGLQSFARRTGKITLGDRFMMRVCCEHISQAPRVISTWFCAEKIYFWSYADGCMKRVYRLNLQTTWPFHLPNR